MTSTQFEQLKDLLAALDAKLGRIADACERSESRLADADEVEPGLAEHPRALAADAQALRDEQPITMGGPKRGRSKRR